MPVVEASINGLPVMVELSPEQAPEHMLTSTGGLPKMPEKALENALRTATLFAEVAKRSLLEMGAKGPESAELEFGLKLSIEGNVWLAKAASEAQFTFKFQLKK